MKHLPDYMQEPDRPRSLDELRCRLNRRLSDFRHGWRRCDKPLCRRRKQCCGEGPEFKCTNDGRPRRKLSPEEEAKVRSDLYKAVKKRAAEYAAGAEPMEPETPRKLDYSARAAARRRRKAAKAGAAKRAAPLPQADRDKPQTPVAEETQLAPEQQERIDQTWNDDVASQPAEQGRARERRPRITQL
ncbi:MAG TPA: hypothetical protein VN838_21845 [Bradyrhizobium sp.]|nr:hypothetical protein [Bradyrhizobium sp.]